MVCSYINYSVEVYILYKLNNKAFAEALMDTIEQGKVLQGTMMGYG